MHKTASLAMLLSLLAPLGACGSSDDEPTEEATEVTAEPSVGRLSLAAPADVAAAPADADVTASGLASKQIVAGTGSLRPSASDTVRVDYVGWQTDGTRFDESERGPVEFPLSRVIDGWTEGLQLMVEGEVRRFWIPAELAYGQNPSDPDLPAGDLVFDVDLIAITSR